MPLWLVSGQGTVKVSSTTTRLLGQERPELTSAATIPGA